MSQTEENVPGGWEFFVRRDGSAIELHLMDDAFAALVEVPAFFMALGKQKSTTLGEVVEILGRIGAEDVTERARPTD